MSYIPDTRTKYSINPYKRNEGDEIKSPNCYYEKLLPEEMKAMVEDFDTSINHTLSYFDNIDVYEDEFEGIGIDLREVNIKAVTDESRNLNEENHLTKEFGIVYQTMKDYLMMERNEFIVGLIDSIEEDTPEYEEYKTNYKNIFGEDEYKKEFEEPYTPNDN